MFITTAELSGINLHGKTIAFATDTVFGVGALPEDTEAIEKIYQMKDRDYSKPLALLFSNDEDVLKFINVESDLFEKMKQFWPGAVTFIVPKKQNKVQPQFTSLGIRKPDSKVACSVLNEFGSLLVTSLNKSGQPPVVSLEEIAEFPIDYIVIDTQTSSQIASTVVDLLNRKIIRKGSIDENMLWETFPIVNE